MINLIKAILLIIEKQIDSIFCNDRTFMKIKTWTSIIDLHRLGPQYLQANPNRATSMNDAFDMKNRKLGEKISIYEARAIKAQKESKKAQVKLKGFMRIYEEIEGE